MQFLLKVFQGFSVVFTAGFWSKTVGFDVQNFGLLILLIRSVLFSAQTRLTLGPFVFQLLSKGELRHLIPH